VSVSLARHLVVRLRPTVRTASETESERGGRFVSVAPNLAGLRRRRRRRSRPTKFALCLLSFPVRSWMAVDAGNECVRESGSITVASEQWTDQSRDQSVVR
jgi:hypothetical protein